MAPRRPYTYFAALMVGTLVAILASAGGTANDRLHRIQAREDLTQQLQRLAVALRTEVERLFVAATANAPEPSGLFAWSYDGRNIREGPGQLATIAPVTLALSRLSRGDLVHRLLGPYPTADGRLLLVALAPDLTSPGAWRAAGVPLDELFRRSGVDALLRAGVDISVADRGGRRTLFNVQALPLADPVRISADLRGARWEIDAEPRAGWARPALARWVLILLLSAGSAYWLFRLLDAPERMSVNHAYLLRRIDTLNTVLAEALRSKELAEAQRKIFTEIDAATGVASRRAFCEAVERELQRIRGTGNRGLATIVVQFEQARALATAFTHASIDEILRQAALRLLGLPGLRGTVGRVSDIELATWIETPADNSGYETTAQLIVEELSRPYTVSGLATHVSFAVGVALSTTGNTYAEDVLSQACTAAQEALSRGSATCLRYEPTTRERTITRLHLESDLRRSLAGDGLCLHFQPIVTLDTRQVVGFEALLRWQHPLEGLLLPGRFIPIAESAHLMLDIDRWVMRQAVAQVRQWGLDLERDFFLSVNVSPQNFPRRELVTEINQLLIDLKVPPERLRIEVTESALISDLETATVVASELRSLGIRICLDDFGTGYSSLNYLRSLPLDSLKVDRSFIERMVSNSKDFGVVKTIIDLAHYLELTCIVEGVETSEQHELLQVLAPEFAQGFLYSPAMPADRAEQALRDSEPMRRMA